MNRILAGLLATALPTFAFAQEPASGGNSAENLPPGFVAVSEDITSPNLELHTVQKKEYSDAGTQEVVLYPAILQLNTKFTDHIGVGAQYLYHLHENFALQVMGEYFYVNQQVGFVDELVNNASLQPEAATALTLQWAATGGFEVTPIYGKFAFYEGAIGHFSIVLSGGAGVGGSRVQLNNEGAGQIFGDTGLKFVGQVGAGFRVRLNEDLLIRLEFRDLVYTAKVDKINGCSHADLVALDDGGSGQVNASCRVGDFNGNKSAMSLAKGLVEEPSSDVLNNVGVYGGLSYTF